MKKIFLAGIFFILLSAANFANAATVEKHLYNNVPDLIYPVVSVENPAAAEKINSEIRKDIRLFLDDIRKKAGEDYASISISYEIPCNHDGGILSIILREFVMLEKAAHPWNLVHTLNFNTDSGERLTADTLSEIARHGNDYTPAELTRKLKIWSAKNNRPLYSDFQRLTEIPEDFYFDENLHVHFLFQQQSVAHYAVGIIDLDADATY